MKNLDSNVTLGWQPKWFMTKEGLVENPDYFEPPPTEPDEDEDVEGDFRSGFAGCWAIPAAFGKTMIQTPSKPSWWRRKLVALATGWTWEDYK